MFAKNCHLHWIAGMVNILCKYLIFVFFQFWAFATLFLCYLQKLQFLVIKKNLNNFEIIFVAVYFYLYELKK